MHRHDQGFWDEHWREHRAAGAHETPASPYPLDAIRGLAPGTALDAGCGAGAEAIALAKRGWRVTGVDVSRTALELAGERARSAGVAERVEWIEADLTSWQPAGAYDLVVSGYAHTALPAQRLVQRLASWVAPGGTLLVVGHLPGADAAGAHRHPTPEAAVAPDELAAALDANAWRIETAARRRTAALPGGPLELQDAVLRATRLG